MKKADKIKRRLGVLLVLVMLVGLVPLACIPSLADSAEEVTPFSTVKINGTVIENNDEPFNAAALPGFLNVSLDSAKSWAAPAGESWLIYNVDEQGAALACFFSDGAFVSDATRFATNTNSEVLNEGKTVGIFYTVAAHVHNYSTEWSGDDSTHWHACLGEGDCDAPKGSDAAHTFGDSGEARYTCTVCGRVVDTRKAQALNQDAADEVAALISAIGTVEYTAESKTKIEAARSAYTALTAEQKALLGNYETLTDAETTYAAFTGEQTSEQGNNSGSDGTPAPTEAKEKKSGLSVGAIAGIVIGSILLLVILVCVVLYILDKKKILNFPFIDRAIEKIASLFKKK